MYVYLYIYVYIYIYIYTYDEVGKNEPLLKKYLNIFAIAFTNCFFSQVHFPIKTFILLT